ncbi:MAG: hypothetical protein SH850_28265, partial [Planctomycetaceae bacterium]|nr:hypothetical protein [Planctomycetaceae bacterium]
PGAANTGSTGQQVAPAGPPTTITAMAGTDDERPSATAIEAAPYAFTLAEPLTEPEPAAVE